MDDVDGDGVSVKSKIVGKTKLGFLELLARECNQSGERVLSIL